MPDLKKYTTIVPKEILLENKGAGFLQSKSNKSSFGTSYNETKESEFFSNASSSLIMC